MFLLSFHLYVDYSVGQKKLAFRDYIWDCDVGCVNLDGFLCLY